MRGKLAGAPYRNHASNAVDASVRPSRYFTMTGVWSESPCASPKAEATRRAVRHWGFETVCRKASDYSSSLTAVMLPEGHSADALRRTILERSNMSLGNGLGILADKVFRIGHLGDFHDLMVTGTLSGVEMGLAASGIPHRPGGVQVAMNFLLGNGAPVAEAAE